MLKPVAWCKHQLSRVPGPDQVGAIINRPVKASLASTCSRAGRDGIASLRSVVVMVQRHCFKSGLLRGRCGGQGKPFGDDIAGKVRIDTT